MADYYAATFGRAEQASGAVTALEQIGVERFHLSYATPALLRPGDREGALEGLRRIFHPSVGLTGALLHLGFTEELARALTAAVEEGSTLLVVPPGDQGLPIERVLEAQGASQWVLLDAAGRDRTFINRRGGPVEPRLHGRAEDTQNPEVARALGTYEGEILAESVDEIDNPG